ncbi:MAG: hypothetical protein U0797_05705 [Gemmataceae bacterium]
MTPDPFDRTCRYLLRHSAEALLGWLLGGAAFDFVQWLDTRRLPWPGQTERVCDTVAHVRDLNRGGSPWAVVVEFQSEPDPDMLGRLLEYLGKLRLDARPTHPATGSRSARGLEIYLTGLAGCAEVMDWPEAGLRTGLLPKEVHLAKLRAGDVLDAAERGEVPASSWPGFPLMQGGGEPGIALGAAPGWLARSRMRRGGERTSGWSLHSPNWPAVVQPWKDSLKGSGTCASRSRSRSGSERRSSRLSPGSSAHAEEAFGTVPEEGSFPRSAPQEVTRLNDWMDAFAVANSLDEFRQRTRAEQPARGRRNRRPYRSTYPFSISSCRMPDGGLSALRQF